MRRLHWLGICGVGGIFTAALVVHGQAQKPSPIVPVGSNVSIPLASEPVIPLKPTTQLPVGKVVLFNSGVAFFQREGDVEGEAAVDLAFPASDINDLMKSLIVTDTGGGRIQPLRYDSQEPVEQTLKSYGINLSENPSYGEILNQARGERIEISLNAVGGLPATLTGTIIGMETQMKAGATGPASEVEQLNLDCAEGMRSVPLAQVQRVRFLNATLERDLRRALDVVARSHDSERKTVRLGFSGMGKRKVKVGYVVENPIWKTTYRLNLEDKQPKLQGWAAIENVTDEDWNGVQMTLISARPISFKMDLYPPLYVPRPLVEPEQFAMLRPQSYNGPIMMGQAVNPMANGAQPFQGFGGGLSGFGGGGQGFGGGAQGFGGGGGAIQNGEVGMNPLVGNNQLGQFGNQGGQYGIQGGVQTNNRYRRMNNFVEPSKNRLSFDELNNRRNGEVANAEGKPSPQAKAQAQQVAQGIADADQNVIANFKGDGLPGASRHLIEGPVSLARKQSAMLPLPDVPVTAEHVSIYNSKVMETNPLRGLRVKNNSDQALMQGPIAVYDGGHFAGEARLADLQPAEERLVSYAVDLGTEIKHESQELPGPKLLLRVEGNSLALGYQTRLVRTYTIRNRNPEDRKIIVEHPINGGWTLSEPEKPLESSRDHYRFAVTAKAGETTTFKVAEVQMRTEAVQIVKQPNQSVFRSNLGLNVWVDIAPMVEEAVGLQFRDDNHLEIRSKQRHQVTYHVQSTTDEKRTIIIEHAIKDGSKLFSADQVPTKKVGNLVRFELALPEKGEVTHRLVQELIDAAPQVIEPTTPIAAQPLPEGVPAKRFITPLGFEVWQTKTATPEVIVKASITNRELQLTHQQQTTIATSVRNLGATARNFTVEHTIRPEWRVLANASNAPVIRKSFDVPAGMIGSADIVEQRQLFIPQSLTKISESTAREVQAAPALAVNLKAAVARAVELATLLDRTEKQIFEHQAESKLLVEEQSRIRQNMEKLPPETMLYKKYLTKLESVETELEKVQASLKIQTETLKRTLAQQQAFITETRLE